MTRTVGHQDRCEIILDPAQALHRGRALDRLRPMLIPDRPRGVMRAPHHVFNKLDDERQLQMARLVNRPAEP